MPAKFVKIVIISALAIILVALGYFLFLQKGAIPSTPKGKTDERSEDAREPRFGFKRIDFSEFNSSFQFSGEIPLEFEIEYIPQLKAISIYDATLPGDNIREKSKIYITYFESDRFLTLNSVDILQREETLVKGHEAILYEIAKKKEFPDFPGQPSWRNKQHKAVDIRLKKDSPSLFYPIAYSPDLGEKIFSDFLNSLEFYQEFSAISVVSENLKVPWEIAFLPQGDLLFTERTGTILRSGVKKRSYLIEGVEQVGEGGLLGMTLHPNFKENGFLYIYLTYRKGDQIKNRVERYHLKDDELLEKKIIIDNIPGAPNHNGGRIKFGPDGYLYITVGDAQTPYLSQDTNSLAGKILRLRDDGTIPADNPFGNAVWSLGHRNPQGLAFDADGRLWATEHGSTAQDEINLIKKGLNYGWPDSHGDKVEPNTEPPLRHSGVFTTWAPAGAVFWQGSLFFVGLRSQTLFEAILDGERIVALKEHFQGEFGRIRAVALGPDNFLYISTSNTDGRGTQRANDDKVIKISTQIFR